MSRQIYFFQTEVDMKAFYSEISSLGACIVTKGQKLYTLDNSDAFVAYMFKPMNLAIFPSKDYLLTQEEYCKSCDSDFTKKKNNHIEFTPCFLRGSNLKKVENGRIYICSSEDRMSYDEEIVKLFGKISRFIKREYIYDKKYLAYMAPDFFSNYSKQELLPW